MKPPIRILDGGLGTALQDKYSVHFNAATPLWSSHLLVSADASQRSILEQCQADFCRAGADVLETATYQISVEGLARSGVTDAKAIVQCLDAAISTAERAAAAAATEPAAAVSSTAAISLSLGPYGACMLPSTEYSGAYDEAHVGIDALRRWHADRLALFADVPRLPERVRFLAWETLPRRDEIHAIRQLFADAAAPQLPWHRTLPYWVSCVFPGGGNDNDGDDDDGSTATLPDGTSAEDAVKAMLGGTGTLPWGIGINCTKVQKLARLVRRYEATVAAMVVAGRLEQWPALVLYPDGTNGEVYNTTTQAWEWPEGQAKAEIVWDVQLSDIVKAAAARGKWREILVGGCCKTTDNSIRALKQRLALLHVPFSKASAGSN